MGHSQINRTHHGADPAAHDAMYLHLAYTTERLGRERVEKKKSRLLEKNVGG